MSTDKDRDAAIDAMVQAQLIAEGRDALQAIEKRERSSGGGGGRGASTSDLDDSPGGPE